MNEKFIHSENSENHTLLSHRNKHTDIAVEDNMDWVYLRGLISIIQWLIRTCLCQTCPTIPKLACQHIRALVCPNNS